jgi:2',3'-cyclic-nucleotide 2'-phosphodiesterase (5'-nucleotidase family)
MKTFAYIERYLFVAFLFLSFSCATPRQQITGTKASFKVIDSTVTPDAKMTALLAPYKKEMDSVMNETIAHSDMPLSKAQPESTLGNFMADVQLEYVRRKNPAVKVSILNYGGIRLPYLAAGAIPKGKIYEIMPFDNMLTIVDIPGKVLKQLCNQIASYGGWPVSGIRFQIKGKEAVDILVNNEAINDHIIYPTVLPDYVANGGDNCDFLVGCKKEYLNVLTRDILIAYLRNLEANNQQLHVNLDKRISYAQ